MSLQDIFEEQIRLNEKINPDLYKEIDDPEGQAATVFTVRAGHAPRSSRSHRQLKLEMVEKDEDDWDNIKIELVDMLHFGSPCARLLVYRQTR